MLDDLTAEEVAVLGHSLRMVPGNAVLMGASASRLGAKGFGFIHELEPFKSLWAKVAEAVRERDDLEPFRVPSDSEPV